VHLILKINMIFHSPHTSRREVTPAEEEYLEAMFTRADRGGETVKTSELAKQLRVKAPSVVQMLDKLKRKGLVVYGFRTGVNLTEKGRKLAAKIVRRHKLAERLLVDVFGEELYKVHDDACKLEHAIDDELADKIEKTLGKPSTCPHGRPIPTANGRVPRADSIELLDVGEGKECTITTIPEERGDVERLISLNILPKSKIKVLEKLPRGAVLVQCGDTQVALSRGVASQILVGGRRRRARRRWGRGS
jgi:DtxR family Mn-dependent transcriptional regulator